jgi:hypothetical protein
MKYSYLHIEYGDFKIVFSNFNTVNDESTIFKLLESILNHYEIILKLVTFLLVFAPNCCS